MHIKEDEQNKRKDLERGTFIGNDSQKWRQDTQDKRTQDHGGVYQGGVNKIHANKEYPFYATPTSEWPWIYGNNKGGPTSMEWHVYTTARNGQVCS